MKIIILDAHAANPGDLNWNDLAALGDFTVYPRTAPSEVLVRAAGAEIIFTNKTALHRETLARLPQLKFIGVLATGYNVVDTGAARELGITVANIPAYSTESVVQMVFAHLLNLTMRVGEHSAAVRAGDWTKSPDFCFWNFPLIELADLTLGVIGYGKIGKRVAEVARAFGMDTLIGSRSPQAGIALTAPEEIFRRADAITLHCPLTPQTEKIINAENLALMKPTAFLINTGRGGLIDEPALAHALNFAQIAGAGLDVLSVEPPAADNPLLTAKNCYLTPHIAWATFAARRRLIEIATANLRAFLAGAPINVVN